MHSLQHIVILRRSLELLAVVSNVDVKFHRDKLASFCQQCGNFVELNSERSRHKLKLAADFSKELQLVDGLDKVAMLRQRTQSFCVDAVLLNLNGSRNQRTDMIAD